MNNINDIPKDIDTRKALACEIDGKQVSLDGVGEIGFAFEDDANTFVSGMEYLEERGGPNFITSDVFTRTEKNEAEGRYSQFTEYVIRIIVGDENLKNWQVL